MLLKGNYRGGKHNPKLQDAYKVHKSSAGQQSGRRPQPFNPAKSAHNCKQEEAKGQQYGGHPQPFNAAKFARNCKQAEAKGNTGWWTGQMLSRPGGVPEKSNTEDIDMKPKMVEEQATETTEWNKVDEDEDENKDIPDLEMLFDGPSTDSPMADSPVKKKIGEVKPSSKPKKSTKSELQDSDEMDIDTTTMGPNANTTTDRNANSVACSDEMVIVEDHGMSSVEELYEKSTVAKYNKNPAGEPGQTVTIGDHNVNLVGESHETSNTLNHSIELAKGPVHTPTTADHDKKSAGEPDKTSETADIRADPVETSDNKKVEIKPFNFLGCPDNVRQQILRCILVSVESIKPYWSFGALEVAEEEANKESFTTTLTAFAGDENLIDEATTILYGENKFKLEHAKVSLWWLKRIGSNISKIKSLDISVEEGVMEKIFGTRFETLWYSIFFLLKAQHRLQSLKVSFEKWTDKVDDDGLHPSQIIYIWEPRRGLVRTLLSFRDLDWATIKPGPYVPKYVTCLLEDALVLGQGQTNQELIELEEDIQGPKRTKVLFSRESDDD